MTPFNRVLIGFWHMVVLTCVASCGQTIQELPAATATLIVTDSATGEKINGFLLVTRYIESPEVTIPDPPIAHLTNELYHTQRVDIVRANSPFLLKQLALSRRQWWTLEGTKTRFHHIEYYVEKEGYYQGQDWLNGNRIVAFTEMGTPIRVRLVREEPGQPESDVAAVGSAEYCAEEVIPFVAANDPLRDELLSLLENKIEKVVVAGQYKMKNKAELQKIREELRQLRGKPEKSGGK